MGSQRYVSNDLTHFVGRTLIDDDKRYDLLVQIIRSGKLSFPPHDGSPIELALDFSKPVTTDGLALPCIICFCDIPLADLSLHMSKYSQFGISFSKTFLVGAGASPVFYVARDAASSFSSCISQPEYQDRIDASISANKMDKS